MSAAKYANLPDIDTAADIYETEDSFAVKTAGDESEDETGIPQRPTVAKKHVEPGREELDASSLTPREAEKKFRNAEKKAESRQRSLYVYPPSPTSEAPSGQGGSVSSRMRHIQEQLAALESDLADPSFANDLGDEDPAILMRSLVDVRSRLAKVRHDKEGRARLVDKILHEEQSATEPKLQDTQPDSTVKKDVMSGEDSHNLAEMDRRLGELEALIGSSTTTLDETTPLPAPVLPTLVKLSAQLTLLAQPRHLDSISRRLKVFLSDLDRISSHQQAANNRRQNANQAPQPAAPVQSALQEQFAPILTRLAPHLPHIPYILTRLRTLATLHASAGSFQATLTSMEEEQARVRSALNELSAAVERVEKSLEANQEVVKGNVSGLEDRVDTVLKRLATEDT